MAAEGTMVLDETNAAETNAAETKADAPDPSAGGNQPTAIPKKKAPDPCPFSRDLPGLLTTLVSGGEAYHKRHHTFPRLAQNAPSASEDYIYGFVRALERCGLVWDCKTMKMKES